MRCSSSLPLKTVLHFISSPRGIKYLLTIFIFLHILRSILLFPNPTAIIDHNPIFSDDHSYHFYYSLLGSRFLTHHHTTWGYDPYFMAGYPKTIMSDPSNKIAEALTALLFFISPAVVYKITILFTIVLIPILAYHTCRNMELTAGQSMLGALLGTAYFWLGASYRMITCGWFSFLLVSYLCPFIYSAFYRFFRRGEFRIGLLLTICVPLSFLLHLTAPVILIVPLLLLYLFSWRMLNKSTQFTLFLILVLTLVINWFWLIPFLEFYHYRTTSSQFFQSSGAVGFIRDYLTQHQNIELLLLVFGLLGLYRWRLRKEHLKFISLGGATLFLLFLSYFGSVFTLTADLQPMRFKIPLHTILVIPAAFGLWWSITTIKDNYAKKDLMLAIFFILIMLIPLFADKMYVTFLKKPYFFETSMHPGNKALVTWILENTTREGRILIEDSGKFDTQGKDQIFVWGHQFYFTHFPALLPYYTGREFIGGPYPYSIIKHHFAEFHDGILFKKEIDTLSLPEVKRYFDLYNIKWIVCWSKKSREFFNKYPRYLLNDNKVDKFYIYTVNRTPSFFYKGNGQIISDYNKLQLTKVKSEDEIIIKYHWLKHLKTDPPRPIEKVMIMDDPIGFIKIHNPPPSILVYNSYGKGGS